MASPEAIVRRCYLEKLVLKVKQNSQENIRVGTSFLTLTQILSSEICKIFKNTYVEEYLWTTAFASQVLHPAASNTAEDFSKQQQERKKYSLKLRSSFFLKVSNLD